MERAPSSWYNMSLSPPLGIVLAGCMQCDHASGPFYVVTFSHCDV